MPHTPLVLLIDGVVSCLRTYHPWELWEIIEKLNATDYQWQVGEHSESLDDEGPLLIFERNCAGEPFLPLFAKSVNVLRMEHPIAKVVSAHFV